MTDKTTSTKTVAIISDTHGELDARIMDLINQSDIAVHAGDIGDAAVLLAMRPKAGKVYAVRGNNDHPVLWPHGQSDTLKDLPEIAEIDLPGGRLSIEHGDRHNPVAPDHQALRDAFPDSRLIIYGHTHNMVIDTDTLPWVANPGAAGNIRTRGGPSCLLLRISGTDWELESVRFEA